MSVASVPFQSGDRVSVNNDLFSAGSWYEHCHQQSLSNIFEDHSESSMFMIDSVSRLKALTALLGNTYLSKKGPYLQFVQEVVMKWTVLRCKTNRVWS